MTKVLKQRYPRWVAKTALTHPVAGCTGAFRTGNQTTFMANPDPNQDSWLSSDEDLTSGWSVMNSMLSLRDSFI